MAIPTLKTENLIRMENAKLTIEQLVDIGDAIHDSTCSFILVCSPTDENGTTKITLVNHGNEHKVKKMISDVIKRSPRIKDILVDALLICEMEQIKQSVINDNLD